MAAYNPNNMFLPGDCRLDDVRNAIALRSDIHSAFADGKFAIVPKQTKWVVHFTALTNSLGDDFHNTHIHLRGVSAEFLYARFAWTIFPFLSLFLDAHIPRALLVRLPEGEESARLVPFEEIRAQSLWSRSRSARPLRRHMASSDDGAQQHAAKRFCAADRSRGSSRHGAVARAPLASYTGTTSLLSASSSSPKSLKQPDIDTQTWIRSRRPSDPSLYCCDYNKAEQESREVVEWKRQFGGAYVCLQCRGVEYLEDRDKDVEEVSLDPE